MVSVVSVLGFKCPTMPYHVRKGKCFGVGETLKVAKVLAPDMVAGNLIPGSGTSSFFGIGKGVNPQMWNFLCKGLP